MHQWDIHAHVDQRHVCSEAHLYKSLSHVCSYVHTYVYLPATDYNACTECQCGEGLGLPNLYVPPLSAGNKSHGWGSFSASKPGLQWGWCSGALVARVSTLCFLTLRVCRPQQLLSAHSRAAHSSKLGARAGSVVRRGPGIRPKRRQT